jgi:hypothetical protein
MISSSDSQISIRDTRDQRIWTRDQDLVDIIKQKEDTFFGWNRFYGWNRVFVLF